MKQDEGIVGKHYYANLYDIDPEKARDEESLKKAVIEAAKLSVMNLVDIKSWSFGGNKGGVSVIALVVESHIAVHTWIEYSYATVDVYTCGKQSNPLPGIKHIINHLKPKTYKIWYADRSQTSK